MKPLFNKIRNFFEDNSFILFLFLIYVLFHTFFEKNITSYLVNTFFCYLTPSLLNDLIILILVVLIAGRFIISFINNYFISDKAVLISSLLFLSIGYYRFLSDIWSFTSMYLIHTIKYIDIILLFLVSNIIIRCLHKERKYSANTERGFSFDNPIEQVEEDALNRSNIAGKIAEKIKNTANFSSSFALGITSEWGRGKTSFLHLIEDQAKGEERVIMHFNPWLNNDEKAIVKSFFDELSGKLKNYNKELSNELLTYSETLNEIGSDKISWISKIFPYFFKKANDLRQQFDSINKAIQLSGLQIIIFIDDLDRLYEKEILEVLRLIRNSANFSNTVFIVAYDRSYLISAISKANNYHPNFYLEKIFQIEIALPTFEKDIIIKRLKESLTPHLEDKDKENFKEILENYNQNHLFNKNYFHVHLLENLRDVNRFVNSFIISYEALKGESELLDLLNIELLRIKFLGIYNLFADDYNLFLTTSHDQNSDANYLTLAKIKEDNQETGVTCLEQYLKTNYQDVGIQENQIGDALKHIFSVFPEYSTFPTVKISLLSIANPISIDRYFHYNLLSSNISEIEFSNYRSESYEKFQTKIEDWIRQGYKHEVSRRLKKIEYYSNKEDYEKIMRIIFFYASFPGDNLNGYIGFDEAALMEKLSYTHAKPFYSTQNDFIIFVQQLFKDQKASYSYASALIRYIFDNAILEWNFILPRDLLIAQKLEYFTNYSKSINKIDIQFFRLFSYCNYKEWILQGNTYQTKVIRLEESKKIFIECASRILESFIKNIISKTSNIYSSNSKNYSILKTVTDVWDSWDNFEVFLFGLNEEDVSGLAEFKIFYSKCKEVNFEHYIDFDFKEIDLSDAVLFSN